MKFDGIEHFDKFDEVIIFWIDASEMPPDIQEQAKQIAMEDYEEDWFGLCVHYNFEDKEFYIVTDTDFETGESCNVFYIDYDGDKHWFKTDIPDEFVAEMFEACRKELPDQINGVQDNDVSMNQQM